MKKTKEKLTRAGIAAPDYKLDADQLAARLRQRANRVPNKRRTLDRTAARGGTVRWLRDS